MTVTAVISLVLVGMAVIVALGFIGDAKGWWVL